MKKFTATILALFSVLSLLAQQEKMDEYTFCSGWRIMNYLDQQNVYKGVFQDPDRPNADKAVAAAWSAFNEAFSLEGLPHGMISEVFEPASLENINKTMGAVGNSLALIQIAHDYSNGDKLSAMNNSVKTSMFYAIGKWGWKSLKLAGTGLQVFDYMLTSFGQYAVSARQDALAGAYNKYYLSGMGKRNLTQWKVIIEKVNGKEAIQKEIDTYLNKYFEANALDKEISGGWYTDKEVKAVKKDYLNTYLLPYLKPLFLRLEEDAREEKLREICDHYKKVIRKLNTEKIYRIELDAPVDKYPACEAGIEVMMGGNKKLFVKSSLNDDGFTDLSFTKYSLLKNKVTKARAVLRYESPVGPKTFYRNIDLKKDKMAITFTLPEEEKTEDAEEGQQVEIEKKEVKRSSQLSPGKEKPQREETASVELSSDMKAIFTINAMPLNVKVKKIKETSSIFTATFIHKKLPKGNVLTINKVTREMSFVYKLKGAFAPQLLCKGLPVTANTYSGTIVTNDVNTMVVGTFTLVLLGN